MRSSWQGRSQGRKGFASHYRLPQALSRLLYSSRRETYAAALPLEQLCLLSTVCHRFSFEDLLGPVDQTIAKHSGDICPEELQGQPTFEQYLKPENAAAMYWDARAKGMDSFQVACANYTGAHVEVAEAAPEDALGPVLVQAAKHGMDHEKLHAIKEHVQLGVNHLASIPGCYQCSSSS